MADGYSHKVRVILPAIPSPSTLASMLDKRLIFVTGKGGVGKSTVAAALGVAAARRGKRTIVCEVAAQERMSGVFHKQRVGYHETRIAENLYGFSVDPQRALEEYLLQQIRVKPLYDMLFKNRVFTYFAAATPGMRELVTIGKVWELAQLDRRVKKAPKYDVVIVDAPATGHGLGILRTPKTFGDIARVGPIKRQADAIHEFITDPKLTAICAVAWPEEMPVNETLDLQRSLRKDLGMKLSQVYMNGLYPELFSDREAQAMRGHLQRNGSESGDVAALRRAAVRAAVSEHRRAKAHREQLERLQDGTRQPVVELPFLFTEQIDMEAVGELADDLEPSL